MAPFERRPAFRFNTPSSMMVVGPSGCGKTFFTTKLLVDNPELFETPPKKIYHCYGSWQDGYKRMKQHGIKFHEGKFTLFLILLRAKRMFGRFKTEY